MRIIFRRQDGKGSRLSFKQWFLLILNIILILAAAASIVGVRIMANTLESLTAAERFRGGGETRFAQLACFLPVGEGKTEEDILTFRQSLEGKMVEQSLEAPEGGRLYIDAYCAAASVNVNSEGGAASVEAVGVGGDFFYFHPFQLRSGAYFDGEDLMDDLVVLDEELAWKLFGGTDLAGMTVYINEEPFVVAGVISREEDFASKKAYSGDGGLFMSFSAMSRLIEEVTISSYEVVMPDPISGYAKGVVKEIFPIGKGDVVENSDRYGLPHLVTEVIGGFGQRSMRTNGVVYPYWENAVRLTEDYAALLLALAVVFGICPAGFALVFGILAVRRGYRYLKKTVPEKVEAGIEKRREKRLEKKFHE